MNLKQLNCCTRHLISRKETIAAAESVTAGRLQTVLAAATDAAAFFQGGITAYNTQQKQQLLKTSPGEAFSSNAVSPLLSEQMALGVSAMFSSDWGIGITGYAEAMPGLELQDIHAWFAVAYKGKIVLTERIRPERGSLERVQQEYAESVIKHLQFYMETGHFQRGKEIV